MKIALIGYGKMGKAIEEIALHRGHEIVLKIDEYNLADFNKVNISKANAGIEFTGPHSAYENVKKALEFDIPLVCGSTGWLEKLEEVKKLCIERNGSFIYASNFSAEELRAATAFYRTPVGQKFPPACLGLTCRRCPVSWPGRRRARIELPCHPAPENRCPRAARPA